MSKVLKLVETAKKVPPTFPQPPQRPCWKVYDDCVKDNGKEYRSGVYQHLMSNAKYGGAATAIDLRVCGPLYVEARTVDSTVGSGANFGLLLRFKNRSGKWRRWAVPSRLLVGDAIEFRQELADQGLSLEPRQHSRLLQYVLHREPTEEVQCTTSVGWCGDEAFVLPDQVYGSGKDKVVYQSDSARVGEFYVQAGDLQDWQQNVAAPAVGNPLLALTIASAFVGPVLSLVGHEGGGVHLVGSSSGGKTTMLGAGRSVWGPKAFQHTWRATSNGLEGIAALHNDCLLPMDEISECDPREVGLIAYMLTNGQGKARADRVGRARDSKRWRVFILSTGERTLGASMEEAKLRVKAGQTIRILDVPADRKHGCFDELHGHATGQAFADCLKAATGKFYGTAGRAFLEALTKDERDLGKMLEVVKATADFQGDGNQAGRAAARFAMIGLAGELATEYGITGWLPGTARAAAVEAFRLWQDWFGKGNDEPRRIKQAVLEFIEIHGASRFSDVSAPLVGPDAPKVYNQAGWLRMASTGETIYCFHGAGLRAATRGFDFNTVTRVLVECGALSASSKQNSTNLRIGGTNKRVYEIDEEKLRSGAPAVDGQAPAKKPLLKNGKASKTKKGPMNADTADLAKEL